MSSSDRKENLFAQALLLSEAEWPAFLDRECRNDPALRPRLEALLKAHQAAGQFMDTPVPVRDPAKAGSAIAEREGTRIGRYKLLQKIGEGGCGVVWMAEQEEDVRRQVAVKIIKLGMDTREVIARFEAERQAMALMDHPNIAKILDAGSTDAGRPYFVMELVKGIKITDFCDKYGLSTAQRLDLFLQVCHGVQHAHQKGVIHRDLKPSNVLVTLADNQPVAKVIDFGIAKATTGRLTDHTLFTAFEQFMGTPAYMSPEQAELSAVDIDTRSDIYSLGVLLYELLTGRLPFDPKTLLQSGLDEIRRIIREVEPPRPSTHLSTLGASDQAQVARMRNTDPAKLSLLLRGDLDWIIMRCLEKNRTRRYATTNALAADITRHIHHEPVVARPASRLYKLGRLIRRNRLVSAAVAAVALALIVGMIISTWQAVRATRAEKQAVAERAAALAARNRADELLKYLIGDLYQQLDGVAKLEVLDSVTDKAVAYLTSLGPSDANETTPISRARVLRLQSAIRASQGRSAVALTLLAEAYELASHFAASHPRDLEALFERSQIEVELFATHWLKGDYPAAAPWAGRYLASATALVARDPTRRDWQLQLFDAHYDQAELARVLNQPAAARTALQQALAVSDGLTTSGPGDEALLHRVAMSHFTLGHMAELEGNYPEATTQYQLRVSQLEKLSALDLTNAETKQDLAAARLYVATLDMITGRYAAAAEPFDRAQASLAALLAKDRQNVVVRKYALIARLTHAARAAHDGQTGEAARAVDEALADLAALAAQTPPDRLGTRLQAQAWRQKAEVQFTLGAEPAADAAARAVTLGESLQGANETTALEVYECARDHLTHGLILAQAGEADGARRAWLRASELLAPTASTSRDWHILDPYARALLLLGRPAEAAAVINRLKQFGYVPLQPWPTRAATDNLSGNSTH